MRSKLRPSPAMVVALIALFVALGGSAAALSGTNTVDSGDIIDNQVKSADVRNDNLTNGGLQGVDLKAGSVGTSEVANQSLTTSDIQDNSLDGIDINESTLGNVPYAVNAGFATGAGDADTLDGKDSPEFFSSTGGSIFGNVSVGGTLTLSNYLQLPYAISGSAPAPTDCDEGAELGRVVIRTDGATNLYLCTGTGGWIGK